MCAPDARFVKSPRAPALPGHGGDQKVAHFGIGYLDRQCVTLANFRRFSESGCHVGVDHFRFTADTIKGADAASGVSHWGDPLGGRCRFPAPCADQVVAGLLCQPFRLQRPG
jgi:hypothetical protein